MLSLSSSSTSGVSRCSPSSTRRGLKMLAAHLVLTFTAFSPADRFVAAHSFWCVGVCGEGGGAGAKGSTIKPPTPMKVLPTSVGPKKLFVMRHAESTANAKLPKWGDQTDPPLTKKGEGRDGQTEAKDGGAKFAEVYPELLSDNDRKDIVFLVSPMRRAMETASFFIQGLVSSGKYGTEADYAGREKIILTPEIRETGTPGWDPTKLPKSEYGTETDKWPLTSSWKDIDGNPFSDNIFFLQNADDSQHSWFYGAEDKKTWPSDDNDNKKVGVKFLELQKRSWRMLRKALAGEHFTQQQGAFDMTQLEGKIVFMVTHSTTMFNNLGLYDPNTPADPTKPTGAWKALDFSKDWKPSNEKWKTSVPFEVDLTTLHDEKPVAKLCWKPEELVPP